jgi:hypothetical protein
MKTKVSDRYKLPKSRFVKTKSSVMQTDDLAPVTPNPYATKTDVLLSTSEKPEGSRF